MGLMYVRVKISRRPNGPSRTVRMLVDTGANASMVPRAVLESLKIEPHAEQELELADGSVIKREVGGAFLTLQGLTAAANVVFGENKDAPLLGVIALEELGLSLDPRSGRLRKTRRIIATARASVPAEAF